MIKKSNKLSSKDIAKKPEVVIREKTLIARVFRSPLGKSSLFSFTTPKKVEKKAVLRNKFKRMGFSAVKKFTEVSDSKLSVHFIFNRPPTSKEELEKEIHSLLNRINK